MDTNWKEKSYVDQSLSPNTEDILVLLVFDDTIDRTIIRRQLKHLGFTFM